MHIRKLMRSGVPAVTVAIALAAVLAVLAVGALGAAPPRPSPSPSPPPSSGPTPSPAPTTPPPSQQPSDDATDGIQRLDLVNWPGVPSPVIIWDETGSLLRGVSGQPDRFPTSYEDLELIAIDEDSLQLTWSDLPIENEVRVSVRRAAEGRYIIVVTRPLPSEPSDGVVSDRVLVLDFAVSIPLEDVSVEVVEDMRPSASLGFAERGLAGPDGIGLSFFAWDESGSLSGVAVASLDGSSAVAAGELLVEQVDDDSVRVSWSDTELAGRGRLSVRRAPDGTYLFILVRDVRQAANPSVPVVRHVVLDFTVAISTEEIEAVALDDLVAP